MTVDPGSVRGRPPWFVGSILLASFGVVAVALVLGSGRGDPAAPTAAGIDRSPGSTSPPTTSPASATIRTVPASPPTSPPPTTSLPATTTTTPFTGWSDPAAVGEPWGDAVEGVLTFRGNPTRTFHGAGPVPTDPVRAWRYPDAGGLCAESSVGGETRLWCGTGWTGQPAIWESGGRTLVAFGAYDRAVHVLDADTGEAVFEPFVTGDIIKGSVTIDPDGYPLLYTGSRDNFYRVLALDRGELTELWRLSADAVAGTRWNNDWDGAGLVIDDHLFIGGENSVFHIVKLGRGYDDDGRVVVEPELVFDAPGYDEELLAAVGSNVSIESSVAIWGDTVYFANSGGLVQGWDVGGLAEGIAPTRTFRYWVGDDVDATVVVDEAGFLYVGAEYERATPRSAEVGQIVKLDPSRPDDPLVWSVFDDDELPGGVWATPALHRDLVVVATDGGRVLGVDRETGEIRWTLSLPEPLWMSPTIVDDVLLQGDCAGVLHAFDVSTTSAEPPPLWTIEIGGCLESSPAVWGGRIIVGSREGGVHAIADR